MNQNNKLLNKLMGDESFVSWVYTNKDSKWSAWLANNMDKKDVVENAKRIILSMKFKSEVLPLSRIEYIKNSIEDNIVIMENRSTSSRMLWSPWIGRAAVLLIMITFGAVMYFIANNQSANIPQIVSVKYIEKSTHKGQKLTTNLPDGSKVTLNSSSKISYKLPFNGEERIVMLEGEAFFKVARDTIRPFKVLASGVTTTALGTSFNVNCITNEKVEVSLVSGKVAIENQGDKSVILYPGELAMAGKSKKIEKGKFEYLDKIAWKDGFLVFNNDAFPEIVEKLEGWYGVNIMVHEGVGEDFHFTAKYEDHTLREVLQGISYVQYFDFSIKGDVVEINFKTDN